MSVSTYVFPISPLNGKGDYKDEEAHRGKL